MESLEELNAVKKKYAAGDTVTLTVYRSGEEIEVELTFDAVPAEQQTTEVEQQPQSGQQYGNPYVNPFNPFEDFFRYFYGY